MGYKKIVCMVTGSVNKFKAALEAAHIANENQGNLIYVYAVDGAFLRSGLKGKMDREITEKEEALERLGHSSLNLAEEIAVAKTYSPEKFSRRDRY